MKLAERLGLWLAEMIRGYRIHQRNMGLAKIHARMEREGLSPLIPHATEERIFGDRLDK